MDEESEIQAVLITDEERAQTEYQQQEEEDDERGPRRFTPVLCVLMLAAFLLGAVVGSGVAVANYGRRPSTTIMGWENFLSQGGMGIVLWNEDPALTAAGISSGTDCANPREITPLPVPKVSDLKQFQGAHRERLYWGTYRSWAYLGIRARAHESLLAGLMWTGIDYDGKFLGLRHYCDDTDELKKYSWLRHDGSTYGRQVLVDHGLVVTTYFLKRSEEGSGYGGDWVVRVKLEGETEMITKQGRMRSLFFYVADEAGGRVNLWADQKTTFAGGVLEDFGSWELHANYAEELAMNFAGLHEVNMINLPQAVQKTFSKERFLPDTSVADPSLALIQLTGVLPFEVDMVFVSGSEQKAERVQKLSGSLLTEKLVRQEMAFDQQFEQTFELQGKVDGEMEMETAKVALSNMLGGLSYFYGNSRIQKSAECQDPSDSVDYWLYWNASLYTSVPARSTYPRGFLWDEGFHQLLISHWDRDMSLEIIANWMDLINVDGWIPREQILGEEALSKVPAEYVNQIADNANPPALLLALREFAEKFETDQKEGIASVDHAEYFRTIFPRLEALYNWLNTSQVGKEGDSYYWRGRTDTGEKLNPPTLTSGLDDYPRASHPSDDERHVDLRCWMANTSSSMALLARVAGYSSEKYATTARKLSNLDRLNELHYDQSTGRYYDWGNHTENVELELRITKDPATNLPVLSNHRQVNEPPTLGWVPQFGMNSLFPFLMHMLPNDSPILGDHLDMLGKPELMWTDVGLRSLGTTSSLYMKNNSYFEAPYWRGPVWMNINYLVLSSLRDYSQEEGPYSEQASDLYQKLRGNLIKNVVKNYEASGYIWEHYDYEYGGHGRGVHPFTGWSSLVLRIMAELF